MKLNFVLPLLLAILFVSEVITHESVGGGETKAPELSDDDAVQMSEPGGTQAGATDDGRTNAATKKDDTMTSTSTSSTVTHQEKSLTDKEMETTASHSPTLVEITKTKPSTSGATSTIMTSTSSTTAKASTSSTTATKASTSSTTATKASTSSTTATKASTSSTTTKASALGTTKKSTYPTDTSHSQLTFRPQEESGDGEDNDSPKGGGKQNLLIAFGICACIAGVILLSCYFVRRSSIKRRNKFRRLFEDNDDDLLTYESGIHTMDPLEGDLAQTSFTDELDTSDRNRMIYRPEGFAINTTPMEPQRLQLT